MSLRNIIHKEAQLRTAVMKPEAGIRIQAQIQSACPFSRGFSGPARLFLPLMIDDMV